MRRGLLALAALVALGPRAAADEAARCETLLRSPSIPQQALGHECRARLRLSAGSPGPAELQAALDELDAAERLAPARKEIHQLRLQALVDAGRAADVPAALQRAIEASAATTASDWTPVPAELFVRGLAEESLEAARVLQKRWPRDPEVLGARGAALAVLERDDEALIYLRAAADAAPSDPVARWNLARLLAYMGRTQEAAAEFSAWSAAETDPERLSRQSCVYAAFVESQLRDRERACSLQQQFCPPERRTACAPPPSPAKESAP